MAVVWQSGASLTAIKRRNAGCMCVYEPSHGTLQTEWQSIYGSVAANAWPARPLVGDDDAFARYIYIAFWTFEVSASLYAVAQRPILLAYLRIHVYSRRHGTQFLHRNASSGASRKHELALALLEAMICGFRKIDLNTICVNTVFVVGLLTYGIVYLIMLCLLILLMYLRIDLISSGMIKR